jgi:hypothetical protein
MDSRDIQSIADALVFDSLLAGPDDHAHGPTRRLFSTQERRDAVNAVAAYEFAMSKDCPAKAWWNCRPTHPAVYNCLNISADAEGAVYACAPFRACRTERGSRIIAAYPAPRIFDQPDTDWLCIHAVIAWNPVDDTAEVLGDPAPQIVGHLSDETNVIFASPRAFLQHWARRRGQYLARRQKAKQGAWNKPPAEQDEVPGVLMIGAPADIRWRPSEMPSDIQCAGVSPAVINKELLKAAKVPRARGGTA